MDLDTLSRRQVHALLNCTVDLYTDEHSDTNRAVVSTAVPELERSVC